jgi:hypothetical protein
VGEDQEWGKSSTTEAQEKSSTVTGEVLVLCAHAHDRPGHGGRDATGRHFAAAATWVQVRPALSPCECVCVCACVCVSLVQPVSLFLFKCRAYVCSSETRP